MSVYFQTAAAGVASVIMNALLKFQSAFVFWIGHPKVAAQAPVPSVVLRVFEPVSPLARAIFNLAITSGVILALIFGIVAGTIVDKLTMTSSGAFEPLIDGSTMAVAETRRHSGIVRVISPLVLAENGRNALNRRC